MSSTAVLELNGDPSTQFRTLFSVEECRYSYSTALKNSSYYSSSPFPFSSLNPSISNSSAFLLYPFSNSNYFLPINSPSSYSPSTVSSNSSNSSSPLLQLVLGSIEGEDYGNDNDNHGLQLSPLPQKPSLPLEFHQNNPRPSTIEISNPVAEIQIKWATQKWEEDCTLIGRQAGDKMEGTSRWVSSKIRPRKLPVTESEISNHSHDGSPIDLKPFSCASIGQDIPFECTTFPENSFLNEDGGFEENQLESSNIGEEFKLYNNLQNENHLFDHHHRNNLFTSESYFDEKQLQSLFNIFSLFIDDPVVNENLQIIEQLLMKENPANKTILQAHDDDEIADNNGVPHNKASKTSLKPLTFPKTIGTDIVKNTEGTKCERQSENLRKRTSEKKYVCQTCNKGFTRFERKVNHERIHCGIQIENPRAQYWDMNIIKKDYDDTNSSLSSVIDFVSIPLKPKRRNVAPLNMDKSMRNGKMVYVCKMCGRQLSSSSAACRHVHIHESPSTKKTYPCQYCSKRFPRKESAQYHEQTHTQTKTFVCEFCNHLFRWPAALAKHRNGVHRSLVAKK